MVLVLMAVLSAAPSTASLYSDRPLLSQDTLRPDGTARAELVKRIAAIEAQLPTIRPVWPTASIALAIGGFTGAALTFVGALVFSSSGFGSVLALLHFVCIGLGITGVATGMTASGRASTLIEQLRLQRDLLRQALERDDVYPDQQAPPPLDPTVPWMVERAVVPRVVVATF